MPAASPAPKVRSSSCDRTNQREGGSITAAMGAEREWRGLSQNSTTPSFPRSAQRPRPRGSRLSRGCRGARLDARLLTIARPQSTARAVARAERAARARESGPPPAVGARLAGCRAQQRAGGGGSRRCTHSFLLKLFAASPRLVQVSVRVITHPRRVPHIFK